MSEWPEQMAEFQRAWVKQQQKLLNDWLESLPGAGAFTPSAAWRQAIDIMEQQVGSALDTQRRSLSDLAQDAKNVEGRPEAVALWLQQMEHSIALWTDLQQQLWQAWFGMLRSSAPTAQTPGEMLSGSWQDMARRLVSMQEQWLSDWTESRTRTGRTPAKKTGKEPQ